MWLHLHQKLFPTAEVFRVFLFTILPVKRTQETRNIHSSTLLSTSMATKGCGIIFFFLFLPVFTKLNHLEIGAQFEPGTGGIEPPTFCLQAWAPTNYANFGWPAHPYKSICYIATPARPPESKLQNPNDFGSWVLVLDFGFSILVFGSWIMDLGSWILDFGFWILGTVWILHKIILLHADSGRRIWKNKWK